MGQFEYSVALAAMKPNEVEAVALAFNAGYDKGKTFLYSELKKIVDDDGTVTISINDLQKIIERDGNTNA